MSHLVSRILLAIFLLPAATLVYVLVMFATDVRSEWFAFAVSGTVTFGFVACYWTLLWRGSVKWTLWRVWSTIGGSILIGALSVLLAVVFATVSPVFGQGFGAFIASIFLPTGWLIATVFVWRETAEERRLRTASGSAHAITCPTCGYNLTGLVATRCPECGTQTTLDALFAAQTEHGGDEVV